MLKNNYRLRVFGPLLIIFLTCSLVLGPVVTISAFVTSTPALTPLPSSESEPAPASMIPTTFTSPNPSLTQEPECLTIDFSGNITKGVIDDKGALISDLIASDVGGSNTIEVPSGTIATDSSGKFVKYIKISETQVPPLPDNKVALSKAYEFQPSPVGFSKSIIITIGYEPVSMPQKTQSIRLAFYDARTESWQDLPEPGGHVAEAGESSGEVNHFTIFAAIANRSPANFSLTQVKINRSLERFTDIFTFFLTIGRNATVTGMVTNEGGCCGIYDGTLLLDGNPVETKNINLEAGENRPLAFTLCNLSPGMHRVQIGSFIYNLPGSESWINWWLISGILIAITILVWLISRKFRKSSRYDRGTTKVKG